MGSYVLFSADNIPEVLESAAAGACRVSLAEISLHVLPVIENALPHALRRRIGLKSNHQSRYTTHTLKPSKDDSSAVYVYCTHADALLRHLLASQQRFRLLAARRHEREVAQEVVVGERVVVLSVVLQQQLADVIRAEVGNKLRENICEVKSKSAI